MRESVCVSHSPCKKPIKEVIVLRNPHILCLSNQSEKWLKVECFD